MTTNQHRFLAKIVLAVFCLSLLQNFYFVFPGVAQQLQDIPCAREQTRVWTLEDNLTTAIKELKEVESRTYLGEQSSTIVEPY